MRYFAAGAIGALIVFLVISLYEAFLYSPKVVEDHRRYCAEAMTNMLLEYNRDKELAQRWATRYRELGCDNDR